MAIISDPDELIPDDAVVEDGVYQFWDKHKLDWVDINGWSDYTVGSMRSQGFRIRLSPDQLDLQYADEQHEDVEPESEGDLMLKFFGTPAGQWKGTKKDEH